MVTLLRALPDPHRLRAAAGRGGGDRHHHQPDHGRGLGPRAADQRLAAQPLPRPAAGLSWAELNERAEVARAIDEPVRGIRVVKAFGREEAERAKVADVTERAFRYSMTRTRLLARYDVCS